MLIFLNIVTLEQVADSSIIFLAWVELVYSL